MNVTRIKQGRKTFYTDKTGVLGERVTSIIDILDKPQLIYWAVNCAMDKMEEMLKGKCDEAFIDKIKREAKNARFKKSGEALDIGNDFHKLAEVYATGTTPDISPYDDVVKRCFEAFVKWAEDNKVEFLESEKMMLYKEEFTDLNGNLFTAGYGGTCDLLCKINGELALIDYKTSKAIYEPAYPMQLVAYKMAYEQELGIFPKKEQLINKCGILRVVKNKEDFNEEDGFESKLYSVDTMKLYEPMFYHLFAYDAYAKRL
jgi:hypothetical protein